MRSKLFKMLWFDAKNTDAYIYWYQNLARIYLDEYEGQKELREEWLRKRLEIDLMNSQTFAEDSSELDITFETVSNLVSKINNKYSENYFTNRWLRRH